MYILASGEISRTNADFGRLHFHKAADLILDTVFGALFDGFADQHQGDQHTGRIEIQMNTTGPPVEQAVKKGTAGTNADERFHTR